jgi:hypothetical protein
LIRAWRAAFADREEGPADAMVSPANSFGMMDGGLDAAIRDELVETGDTRWPALVVAPTMRVPESVAQTLNAYLAFRTVVLACKRMPTSDPSCVVALAPVSAGWSRSGPPFRCAWRSSTRRDRRVTSFEQIHATHRALRTS